MAMLNISAPQARQAFFVVAEAGLLVLTLIAAVAVRFHADASDILGYEVLLPKAVLAAFLLQLCLYCGGLYEDVARRRIELWLRLGHSLLAATLLLSLLYYLFPALMLGRGILLIFFLFAAPTLLVWHTVHPWVAGHTVLCERVLMVGTGVLAQNIAGEMQRRSPYGYKILGFLGEHEAEIGRDVLNVEVIGRISDLNSLVDRLKINLIVVALEDRRGKLCIDDLLACRVAGVQVEEATTFYERLTGKIHVANLRPSWLIFSSGFRKPRWMQNTRRVGEVIIALASLAVLAPLLLLIAALIRLDSRGPILYRQERVGEHGRLFGLLKFRTMKADAEAQTGPVWASADNDPRITRLGRLLRKARLDELPQLLNVLSGEMSFVGPRPERPHFVTKLSQVIPYYNQRHSVKPGITGWAQVKFRYGSTIEDAEEKLQFDLYYIKNISLLFDVAIIAETMKVMLYGDGAR